MLTITGVMSNNNAIAKVKMSNSGFSKIVTSSSKWFLNIYECHICCVNTKTPFSLMCFSILPFEAIVCMYRFLGADKCMYPFLAQRKEAMNNNEAKNGI